MRRSGAHVAGKTRWNSPLLASFALMCHAKVARFPPITDFPVNDDAFAQYAALLTQARRNSAMVKGIVPFVTKASREVLGPAYDRYNSRVRALFRPDEEVIDLNLLPESVCPWPRTIATSLTATTTRWQASAKITEVLARLLGGCPANSKLRPEQF